MNSVSWLLARRYLLKNVYNRGISIIITICFSAIFISAFSLALVAAIMKGLEQATEKSMQGVYPSLSIRGYGQPLHSTAISELLSNQFPAIAHISYQTARHILVYNQTEEQDEPLVTTMIGIEPHQERLVTQLESTIMQEALTPQKNLINCLEQNQVLVGKELAKNLGLIVGDTLAILIPSHTQSNAHKMSFNEEKVVIGGIFCTGIAEYDATVAYCSLELLATLFPECGIEQLNLALVPYADEEKIKNDLRKTLDLEVSSWKDLHPVIVEALALEQYVAWLIGILITLVASMNIISLLCMYTRQKKVDIALLQSLGCSRTSIRATFIYISMIITSSATAAGLWSATLASWIIEYTQCISLPQAYYTTYIPAQMTPEIICAVFALIMAISTLTAFCAIGILPRTSIAQILRFEG